jgi:septum formation protein
MDAEANASTKLILASASPRRRDLLLTAGIHVFMEPADIEELLVHDSPRSLVQENADLKAMAVARRFPGEIVLGADTIVVIDGDILGKPRDHNHAASMLGRLSGRTHEVLTGVCILRGGGNERCRFVESTYVRFRNLGEETINSYLKEINPLDKAGSYAAQEDRGRLIESIEGSMDNVIGLPVQRVLEALARHFPAPCS